VGSNVSCAVGEGADTVVGFHDFEVGGKVAVGEWLGAIDGLGEGFRVGSGVGTGAGT
jgi:hypothetical protein